MKAENMGRSTAVSTERHGSDKYRIRPACPAAVRALMRRFAAHGEVAYPVGGCVRDALRGTPPHDWDVAVTTPPERTAAICEAAGWRVIPTGVKHGTVTVLVPDDDGTRLPIECTTCRTEGGYTDGRHPDAVTFTGLIEDDLSRRYFTVNALALTHVPARDAKDEDDENIFAVIDLFGGMEDLEGRVIRCVGDPCVRLTEDALRILRAVRFAVKLGFEIHPDTRAAAAALADGLARISRERIRDEFEKILLSPDPVRGVGLLTELGLIPYVLPRGIAPSGVGDMAALPPDFSTRLACLLWGMSPDAAKENLRALRLSNEQMDTAVTLQGGRLPTEATPYAARCLRRDYGLLADALLCIAQAHGTDVAALRALVEASATAGDPVRVSDLAVDGRDLRALGVPPGRAIGEVLATLLDEVLADPTQNTKERLSDRVREMRFV